ncbi:MAG: GAP family protein [archaeon]
MRKAALLVLILALSLISPALAQIEEPHCAVYFTGIGCPHCANADPVVFGELLDSCDDLVVIEYEVYQDSGNAGLMFYYDQEFSSGLSIPLLIFGKDNMIAGDNPIITECIAGTNARHQRICPVINGETEFENLDITKLSGKPKIWTSSGILLSYGDKEGDSELLKSLVLGGDVETLLNGEDYKVVEPVEVELSGSSVEFENAVQIEDWVFQWNAGGAEGETGEINDTGGGAGETKDLSLATIFALAAVDAINPCALAVLTLMLIAIITYNPKRREKILHAGLAFVFSVFVMYLFYGLVIIRFFQLVDALTSVRLMLYTILGIVAIALGLLNIKDYFKYKPGGLATEMPMKLRPMVKKLTEGVTSAKGAALVGVFVTLFLLPCTIGPYVIAGGMLSALELLKTLPWLLIYNFIFVLPMLVITLIIYSGIKKVDDVSEWKDNNIKKLHLIAGIVMLLLGIGMIGGFI